MAARIVIDVDDNGNAQMQPVDLPPGQVILHLELMKLQVFKAITGETPSRVIPIRDPGAIRKLPGMNGS